MTDNVNNERSSTSNLANWALLIFSCVFAFAIAEIGARILFAGSNLGWHDPKVLSERIQDCADKNGNVAIFGDSFVEYFKGSPDNMTQVIEKNTPEFRTCNFGFSGTGLDDYLVKWEHLAQKKIVDKAVFVIFAGNDYDDFFLRFKEQNSGNTPTRTLLPVEGLLHNTSKKTTLFNLLKRSVALNAFWRFGYKKWFPQRSFAIDDLINDQYYGTKFRVDPQTLERRMTQIPPDLVAAAKSDHINVHILKRAVFDPAFFKRLRAGYDAYGPSVLLNVTDRISKIQDICKKHHIACGFTFIELDVFTDIQHHPFYRQLGYELSEKQIGPSEMSLQLQTFMEQNQIPYATTLNALQKDTQNFLPRDGHLSVKGHDVLGRLLGEQLKGL